MSAKVKVVEGISQGREFWIESRVFRIGSSPECELCIPSASVPAHACTVEFRAGNYQLFNRSGQEVRLDGRALGGEQSGVWQHGALLEPSEGTCLILELDGDPSPSPKPRPSQIEEPERVDSFVEPAELPRKPSWSAKELVQLAVTILCFLGILLITAQKLMPPKNSGEGVSVVQAVSLDELVDQVKSDAALNVAVNQSLLGELQDAGLEASSGRKTQAIQRLQHVRNRLHRMRNEAGEFDSTFHQQAFDYATQQLQSLK